jgi:hypothetical protein
VASAPPVLVEAGPTVEYACEHCGVALMRVDQSKPDSGLTRPPPQKV